MCNVVICSRFPSHMNVLLRCSFGTLDGDGWIFGKRFARCFEVWGTWKNHFFENRRPSNHQAITTRFRRYLFCSSISAISNASVLHRKYSEWVWMIFMGRIALDGIRWCDICFSNFAVSTSSHMFKSVSTSCFLSLLFSFSIYIYALSMHQWALSGLDWLLLQFKASPSSTISRPVASAWICYWLIHMTVWIGMCHICTNKLAFLNNLAEYI